jgi:hypothetical protein
MKKYSGMMMSSDPVVFEEFKAFEKKLLEEGVVYQLGPISETERLFHCNYGLATGDDCPDAHEVHEQIMINYLGRNIILVITTEDYK